MMLQENMRIRKLQIAMKKQKTDFIVLYNLENDFQNPNLFYLTGFKGLGVLVIRQKGKVHLFVPKMYKEQALQIKKRNFVLKILKKDFYDTINKFLKHKRKITVGLDYNNTTLNMKKRFASKVKKKLQYRDISIIFDNKRAVKDKKEILAIKMHVNFLIKCMQSLLDSLQEKDLKQKLT